MALVEEMGEIAGVVLVRPEPHGDERGRFLESYRRSWFPLGREMVQANRADRRAGGVVGLHYHLHQADYWFPIAGRLRVALVDLRLGSPTVRGRLLLDLDGDEPAGVFIPPGVAHGFSTLTDVVLTYLVDGYYNPDDELGVAYDDPSLGIDWGVVDPVVSARDRANPRLDAVDSGLLPRWRTRT
jgi:dTDP-4-dehydrorhamnose 3,5-epimerase